MPNLPRRWGQTPLPAGVTIDDLIANREHPLRGSWMAENRRRTIENEYIDAQRARVESCAWDMLLFGRTYLPHHFTDDMASFHPELVDLLLNVDPLEWYATEENPSYDPARPTEPIYDKRIPDNITNIVEYRNAKRRPIRDKRSKRVAAKDGIVVAAPRGHAKSTLLTLLIPIYCACYRLRRFILIVSDTDPQVRAFCEAIRAEIEGNELLRRDFGDMVGKSYGMPWTGANFSICHVEADNRGRPSVVYEMMITGRSAGSRVRGMKRRQYRPDLIICDDIENDINIGSQEMRQELFDRVVSVYLPALDPHTGIMLFCGTILHFDSVLNRLLTDPDYKDSYLNRRWAATVDGKSVLDPEAEPVWPSRFTIEWLRRRRKVMRAGPFNREYMNDPRDEETRDYQPQWVRFYHQDDLRYRGGVLQWKHPDDPTDEELRHMLYASERQSSWQDVAIQLGADPAISKSQEADFFTMMSAGHAKRTEEVLILWIVRDRLDFPAQVRTIEQMVNTYPKAKSVAIDATAYQDSLAQATRERFRKRYGRTKVPLKPLRQKNGLTTKETRLRRRSVEVEEGMIWLRCLRPGDDGYEDAPWDETRTVKIFPNHFPLYQEMMQFPRGQHDDCLDVLDMLISVMGRTRAFQDYADREREALGGRVQPTTRTVGPRAMTYTPSDTETWVEVSPEREAA